MRAHKWFTPYLLVAPAVVWVLVFALWPFLNTVVLAFTDARPLRPANPVGFQNFIDLFSDDRFIYALVTCLVYVVVCVPLLTLLPLLVALVVEKKVPGIGFFRTTYYFPVIASVVVVGIIWSWLFDSRGVINEAIQMLGLTDRPVNFLVDRWLLIFTAISLTVWKGIGYYMVIYLAALGNVSKELHEAAAVDGANAWRRFWSITVPGVRGAMFLIAALISVSAMRIFTEIYVLSNGSGGPGGQSMSIVMLVQQVGSGINGRLGYASAISVVLFFLTLGPLAVVGYLNQERDPAAKKHKERTKAAKRAAKAKKRGGDGDMGDAELAVTAQNAMLAEKGGGAR
ncbi:carbohydrate ABC transporter permease [Bowdeniella nasicola]|uniref:carbohydrate ABC transporter permease n=1 Tax=Bowdeniella nasicola TaxID=208480 RepID=UPI0009F95BBA|nr:sugar ABC transporter permease [Bowdeniella nasicola]